MSTLKEELEIIEDGEMKMSKMILTLIADAMEQKEINNELEQRINLLEKVNDFQEQETAVLETRLCALESTPSSI